MSVPKNLTESLAPMLFLYAFIGHGVFPFPAYRPARLIFSLSYAIISMSSYIFILVLTVNKIIDAPWYGEGDRIILVIVNVNAGIAVFLAVLSWSNAKRYSSMIKDMTKVDETLQELGATFNYSRARYEGYGLICLSVVMIAGFNLVDTLWFHNAMSTFQAYLLSTILHHASHTNSIIAFEFCMCVRVLGVRYKKANAILERLARSIVPTKVNMSKNPRNKIIIGSSFQIPSFWTRQILKTTQNRRYLIQIIKHVHLQLGKTAEDLNRAFSVHMGFEATGMFVMFIGLLYELYILTTKSSVFDRYSRIFVMGTLLVVYFLKLIIINDVCERVCKEARRTGIIINCIDENNGDPEMPGELRQFSIQLFHDPLVFNPCKSFILGHQFIKKFMATVTTYLVILIQITPAKR